MTVVKVARRGLAYSKGAIQRRPPSSPGDNQMASRFFAPAITFGQSAPRPTLVDPFRLLQQGMDSLLADVARTAGTPDASAAPALPLVPRINVEERDDSLRITAELPGLSEDDVRVTLDGDVLVIAGEKKDVRETEQGDLRIVERSFGQFRRALQLPFAPDSDKVQAHYKDGILALDIPKAGEQRARARQIEVKRDSGAGSGAVESGSSAAAESDQPAAAASAESDERAEKRETADAAAG
jgi:HSP20 family protein